MQICLSKLLNFLTGFGEDSGCGVSEAPIGDLTMCDMVLEFNVAGFVGDGTSLAGTLFITDVRNSEGELSKLCISFNSVAGIKKLGGALNSSCLGWGICGNECAGWNCAVLCRPGSDATNGLAIGWSYVGTANGPCVGNGADCNGVADSPGIGAYANLFCVCRR